MGMLMKGAMGGMNRNPAAGQTQAAEPVTDDYDVARWQRADGLDAAPTMVQAVRVDWEKRKAGEQKKSALKRFFSRFSRKKEIKAAVSEEPAPRPAGGTIVTPEMKKASQRIDPTAERDGTARRTELLEPRSERCDISGRNYLGLSFQTEIGGFFTANPVNSAILAVDSLGMGCLTLNQIGAMRETESLPEQPRAKAAEPLESHEETGALQGPDMQRVGTSYMNEFHKSREQQKYNVRIRD